MILVLVIIFWKELSFSTQTFSSSLALILLQILHLAGLRELVLILLTNIRAAKMAKSQLLKEKEPINTKQFLRLRQALKWLVPR